MTRLYGRCQKGKRLHATAPQGHWKTTTMISSIRSDANPSRMTIESPTDTDIFRAYVREILCPTLNTGDIVIMDNLGAHKNPQTLSLIEQAGASVKFLPAYSPDLNPIEMMRSKVKNFSRRTQARTSPELLKAIGHALHLVRPEDATNWFTHCGYSFS